MKAFAAMIGGSVLAASVKLPPSPQETSQKATSTSTSNLPNGAIANTNQLQVRSPACFEYPSGYPNILMKNSDGTLTALSMLRTYVCCWTTYDSANKVIVCYCRGSVFDTTGRVLRGPASIPLPFIELTVDNSGLIYPKAVNVTNPCIP